MLSFRQEKIALSLSLQRVDEKKQKVVVPKSSKMPYKVLGCAEDHITVAMCASADGQFLPPMFVFKNTVPNNVELCRSGPENAAYGCSETGHINSDLYFEYIKHLEPFLNPVRPVVIFQDNLICHENFELATFCIEHDIHLMNFPSKVSHLIQPLDKLFGPFKDQFQKKRREAQLCNQAVLSKSNVPIIAKFAMKSMKSSTIAHAFEKTGIYPIDRKAITDDLLVGDLPKLNLCERVYMDDEESVPEEFLMAVYDENDKEIGINLAGFASKQTQTERKHECSHTKSVAADYTS